MAKLTYKQMHDSKRERFAQLQERANWTFEDSNDEAYVLLRTIADTVHAEFPQYEHAYVNHELWLVHSKVETKGGVAFLPGDVCIGYKNRGVNYVSCYSVRLGWDVSVSTVDLEPVFCRYPDRELV